MVAVAKSSTESEHEEIEMRSVKDKVAAHLAGRLAASEAAYDGYVAAKDEHRPENPTLKERFDRSPTGFMIGAVVLIVAVVMVGDYITNTIFPWLQARVW
jgi:hypothetical protein